MEFKRLRIFYLLFTVIGLLTSVSCTNVDIQQKPNVLFIAIDDLKPTIGVYGDKTILTPNIDRLAARGTVFLNNHCQQAVCGPTRASLLTGLYPDQIRVWGFDRQIRDAGFDVLTLPQHFKYNGYHTIGISKIFDYRNVDEYRDSLSWSEPAFPLKESDLWPYYPKETEPLAGYFYQSAFVKNKLDSLIKENPQLAKHHEPHLHKHIKPATECLDLPDHAYKDGIFTIKTIEDLKRVSKSNQPFFLAVGFERPHLPYTAPKKYWDLYDRDQIELSPFQSQAQNAVTFAYTRSGSIKSYSDEYGSFIYRRLNTGEKLTASEQRKLIHGYMAAVTYIDAQVGKIYDALQDLGLEQNTIIVIWGDHGYHLYDHGMWGKSTNFEQSTRSPLIITKPGIDPSTTNVATEFVDLFPTLCDLAGINKPEHLSGQSLMELMKGNENSVKGYAISQFQRDEKMGYAIRDTRYRYVEWVKEGRHVNPSADLQSIIAGQLFDYETDPLETVNYYNSDSYLEVQHQLQNKLHQFYHDHVINWTRPN